jgi:hypothetical protein
MNQKFRIVSNGKISVPSFGKIQAGLIEWRHADGQTWATPHAFISCTSCKYAQQGPCVCTHRLTSAFKLIMLEVFFFPLEMLLQWATEVKITMPKVWAEWMDTETIPSCLRWNCWQHFGTHSSWDTQQQWRKVFVLDDEVKGWVCRPSYNLLSSGIKCFLYRWVRCFDRFSDYVDKYRICALFFVSLDVYGEIIDTCVKHTSRCYKLNTRNTCFVKSPPPVFRNWTRISLKSRLITLIILTCLPPWLRSVWPKMRLSRGERS